MENKSAIAVLLAGVLVATAVFFAPVNGLVDLQSFIKSFGSSAGDTFTNQLGFLAGFTTGAETNTVIDAYSCASVTFNPPSLAPGATSTTGFTLTGASLGDAVIASFATGTQGVLVNGWVSSAASATILFTNVNGGTLDLATSTLKACYLSN